MQITREVLDESLQELFKQREATLSALRAVEGAIHQTQWLIAKLEEPDTQTASATS